MWRRTWRVIRDCPVVWLVKYRLVGDLRFSADELTVKINWTVSHRLRGIQFPQILSWSFCSPPTIGVSSGAFLLPRSRCLDRGCVLMKFVILASCVGTVRFASWWTVSRRVTDAEDLWNWQRFLTSKMCDDTGFAFHLHYRPYCRVVMSSRVRREQSKHAFMFLFRLWLWTEKTVNTVCRGRSYQLFCSDSGSCPTTLKCYFSRVDALRFRKKNARRALSLFTENFVNRIFILVTLMFRHDYRSASERGPDAGSCRHRFHHVRIGKTFAVRVLVKIVTYVMCLVVDLRSAVTRVIVSKITSFVNRWCNVIVWRTFNFSFGCNVSLRVVLLVIIDVSWFLMTSLCWFLKSHSHEIEWITYTNISVHSKRNWSVFQSSSRCTVAQHAMTRMCPCGPTEWTSWIHSSTNLLTSIWRM